jgi:hypothetical protein
MKTKPSLRALVFEFIREHPGCTAQAVHDAHHAKSEPAQPVSDALYVLGRRGLLDEIYAADGTRHLYLKGAAPIAGASSIVYRCPLCRLIAFFRGEKNV